MGISGANVLNSLSQLGRVDRGATQRKGPDTVLLLNRVQLTNTATTSG